jgi:hypothetical protein
MLVLLLGGQPGWSGIVYFLMWPAQMAQGIGTAVWAEKIEARMKNQGQKPAAGQPGDGSSG